MKQKEGAEKGETGFAEPRTASGITAEAAEVLTACPRGYSDFRCRRIEDDAYREQGFDHD